MLMYLCAILFDSQFEKSGGPEFYSFVKRARTLYYSTTEEEFQNEDTEGNLHTKRGRPCMRFSSKFPWSQLFLIRVFCIINQGYINLWTTTQNELVYFELASPPDEKGRFGFPLKNLSGVFLFIPRRQWKVKRQGDWQKQKTNNKFDLLRASPVAPASWSPFFASDGSRNIDTYTRIKCCPTLIKSIPCASNSVSATINPTTLQYFR